MLIATTIQELHDHSKHLRRLEAEHNEELADELVRRFRDHGHHVATAAPYGSAHLTIRFDAAERLLAHLQETGGRFPPRHPSRDGYTPESK